jgi:predicted MPP superfamily phosphohydrolase
MKPVSASQSPPIDGAKRPRFNRRKFLGAMFVGAPVAMAADAYWVEPEWLRITRHRMISGTPTHRFVHFTDLHHKGDRAYLEKVVREVNSLSPDFVCFTGDLIEEARHLPETLELLGKIKSPIYGVPGNHDYWSEADFEPIARCFAATGGAWLLDEAVKTSDGKFHLTGAACQSTRELVGLKPDPSSTNILLLHFPAWVKSLKTRFDLMLAGHSHGGQVRLPFYGSLVVPYAVDEYDWGMFETRAGKLYVGAGIGYFYFNWRFHCRPEIAVFEM